MAEEVALLERAEQVRRMKRTLEDLEYRRTYWVSNGPPAGLRNTQHFVYIGPGGKTVILVVTGTKERVTAWDILIPASDSNAVADTFDALEKYTFKEA